MLRARTSIRRITDLSSLSPRPMRANHAKHEAFELGCWNAGDGGLGDVTLQARPAHVIAITEIAPLDGVGRQLWDPGIVKDETAQKSLLEFGRPVRE